MMVQICYPRREVRSLFLLLSLTTNFDEPISMQSGEQTKLLLPLQSKKKEEERRERRIPNPSSPYFKLTHPTDGRAREPRVCQICRYSD